jgi:hypothetical protein
MTPEEKLFRLQQLQRAELALEELLNTGKISKRVYFKGQVALAHDYLVDHGEITRATDLVRRCEPQYFLADQRDDMEADPTYAGIVIALAKALVDAGLIDGNPLPRFTQPLAKA